MNRGSSDGDDPVRDAAVSSWSTTPSLVVAVLTYRRQAELEALLPVLVDQASRHPAGAVLVVDNDPQASAREVVAMAAASSAVEVRYVHESRPGIAAARNRALDEARGARVLVFIDDDERPVDGWLEALADVHRRTGAGVVGPVVSEYVVEPEPWVVAGRFFDRRRLATGTAVSVAATNNLLLDLAVVEGQQLRFDERFGLSGGSDTLFTRQLVSRGGRLLWCAEAMVVDHVPASRVTRRWVLNRAFRSGNGWTRTSLALAPTPSRRAAVRASSVANGVLRLAGGAGQLLLGVLTGSMARRARGCRTLARGAGMLSALGGHVFVEYARRPAAESTTR